MLIQFRFENFRSFRDDSYLDLSATNISEHQDHVTVIGTEKILPIAGIFGANASGKSNVVEALRFMYLYVLNSVQYGDEHGEFDFSAILRKNMTFLMNSETQHQPSLFEVYFVSDEDHKNRMYNYGFTINTEGEILEEWLNTKAKSSRDEYKPIFYRSIDELEMNALDSKSQELLNVSLNKGTLLISLGAMLKIKKLQVVRDWFYNIRFTSTGNELGDYLNSRRIPAGLKDNLNVQEDIVRYLSTFDTSIKGFRVEETSQGNIIYSVHHDEHGHKVELPLERESDGTLKMFEFYPIIQYCLANGSPMIVDEINTKLHPLLVRNLLLTFLNPEINQKHAQLVFTSHDVYQLSNDALRRDEIWFTEKEADGASSLYSLIDFIDENGDKIRKDANYEKNYLLGRYGAIPSLYSMSNFGGSDH